MMHPLIKAFSKRYNINKISFLKKGESYFSIESDDFIFKDLLNFTSPTDLDGYLKMWTTSCTKYPYPYEYFQSIDEIKQCKIFPDIAVFFTKLRGECNNFFYDTGRKIFEEHMALNDDHPEKWTSFLD